MWQTISAWALGICWGVLVAVWVAGALYNAWRGPRTRTRSIGGYTWIVLGALIWFGSRSLPHIDRNWASVHTWWIRALGMVILLAGTAFALWARGVLGTMWSSAAVIKDEHLLRTDGPYAIVRHPIYTGLLGMLLGTVLMEGLGLWIIVFLVAAILLYVKLHYEERLLLRTFSSEYERYRREVPQLVPGLRRIRR